MKQNYASGRASSIPAGLMWGVGISLLMTLVSAVIIATLVNKEILAWQNIGYGIMIMMLCSSFLGARVSVGKIKRQQFAVSAMFAVAYIGVLLAMTALLFGGQYEGVGVTTLLVLCGSLVSIMVNTGRKREGRGSGSKVRTRKVVQKIR